jgi:hypothetical protein
VGGVADVLQVRVAEEGVAFKRLPVAIRDCEPAVSATVKVNRAVPCRLNTEKSIVDHPFHFENVLTTEADERLEICRWCVYRQRGEIL